MSKRPPRPATPSSAKGPNAVALIEEAIHLLRGLPAGTLVLYYAGAVPWVVGFLYFWAYASWFAPSGSRLAWAALILAGLYAWLKCAQALFCERLLASRAGLPPPPLTLRHLRRVALAQARWQSWGLLAQMAATVLVVPAGWMYAFCQNLTVLAAPDEGTKHPLPAAAEQASLWPAQNHFGLLLIAGLTLGVWINCAIFFYLLPSLAHTLLGMENLFSLAGFVVLNTTFLASVSLLAWVAVDPLVKAYYVLRVFYGRSRRTGADLRGELAGARARPTGALALAIGLLALLLWAAPPPANAAEAAAPPLVEAEPPAAGPAATNVVTPQTLDRAIEDALRQSDFQWRLRPLPAPPAPAAKSDSWLKSFLHDGFKILNDTLGGIGDWLRRAYKWLHGSEDESKPETKTNAKTSSGSLQVLSWLLYTLLAVVVVLLLAVAFILWRKNRGIVTQLRVARVATSPPDLRDEQVQAAQLPAEGWLALAREQLAKGEWRLALRALYLATLARLAAEGLLTLLRSKTNLDYERELTRRAPARAAVVTEFGLRRREFEDVWYGPALAKETQVRAWLAVLEGGSPP